MKALIPTELGKSKIFNWLNDVLAPEYKTANYMTSIINSDIRCCAGFIFLSMKETKSKSMELLEIEPNWFE